MTAPRRLQLRRGNTAAISTYVGAPGELVVNTTTNTLYLHDGSTVGGYATTTNTASITNQISSVNANITLANTGMRGYVDATIAANIANIAVAATYSNVNVKAYTESMGYQNFGNVNVAAYVTTANSAIIGYIDLANTIQSAQVNAANLAITAANLGMKGYVDSVASQSIYGNGNVKSYLTQFNGNIVPSANVTYSLGNVTNRWKDLYLSGNTIYLGDATITTEGSRLVTTGVAISPPTGAVGFANVYYESPTDFAQIRSYYVDNNFGYTANLKSWSSAPIVWDSLRSAKIYHASLEFPDFDPLDTVGGRYANAVCTLDTTGNIASLTITDGGIGYDAYYPYYATDPTGYVYNNIGRSDEGAPQGIGFRRINLVPTTASDIGNVAYLIRGYSEGPTITRGPAAPTVGSNTYTWTGNSGSTFSITIDWTANTSTSFSYTPALPPLTSAQEWQNWLLDYQAAYAGPTTDPLYPDYSAGAYLRLEAYPSILIYDITNAIWFLNVENPTFWQTLPGLPVNLSNNYFRVMIGGPALGYATLESGYGVPVYWSRGLSADTGISSGGDMTVAGDLRVTGDLYVSPTSIYMGDLRISAADGNLKVNTGIKFSDNSVQSTAYSNVKVAAYLTANPPAGTYSNVQVGVFTNLSNYAYNANVTAANVGLKGYVDSQSFYSNAKVATYLPTYSGNISANISKAGYTWTFGADGTTQFPNSLILAPAGQSITMQSDQYSQLMWENANVTVAPNMAINSNFYVTQNNATLDIGYRDGSSTQLIKSWYWSVDGNLKLPSGGYILNSDDSIYGGGNYSNVQVATYLPTYSGVVTASNVAVAGNVTAQYLFGNGALLTGIVAGSSYSNVQVETYLPTYAGTVSASLVNTSGNILSSGLSVFGNTRIGLAGVVSGQFHSVVGNITQTSSGGAVYINTTGNVLAAAVVAGAVTSTGTVAVNAATGITTNQATFLLANATATTINMGGAATTINLGSTASATGNVFVGGQIGSNAYNLTLRANGRYNTATSIDSNGGFNSPPYANQLVIGGTGTGMTANYSAVGGYLTTLTIYNSGTGYRNGDVISVPGGVAGNLFVLQNYSPNRVGAFTGTALYTFGIDGNLIVPGNVSATTFVGSGALLTSLPGYAYGNVNVAAYLNATGYNLYSNVNVANYLTTATITTTGNITAGNLITGGALYVANITTTGASGNISGANYITANVILTNGGWGNISQVALITANVVTATSYIKVTPTTVANLISASTVGAGARDFVTDANTTTFGSVVGGSGANNMPVFSNGTSWLIG